MTVVPFRQFSDGSHIDDLPVHDLALMVGAEQPGRHEFLEPAERLFGELAAMVVHAVVRIQRTRNQYRHVAAQVRQLGGWVVVAHGETLPTVRLPALEPLAAACRVA